MHVSMRNETCLYLLQGFNRVGWPIKLFVVVIV